MTYIESLTVAFADLLPEDRWLTDLPCFADDGCTLDFPSPVTFLVGENGSGKSTILEALAACAGMNPEGGGRNYRFATRESESGLWRYMRLCRRGGKRWRDSYFLRAETFYNVATYIEQLDENPMDAFPKISSYYGKRALHESSHGESFFALLNERLYGNGLYLFDEPEAALSPARQIAMLEIIDSLVQRDSQFIISTHSPILTAFPGATIYEIGEQGITRRAWQECAHTVLYRRFLSAPETLSPLFFKK